MSEVNRRLLAAWRLGQTLLGDGQCAEARTRADGMVRLMAVPLVQGTLRYALRADARYGPAGPKEIAEGWAFARGILPQVAQCSPQVARLIDDNMNISASRPMQDGFWAVQAALESVYSCLGITCGDVGVQLNGTSFIPSGCANPLAGYYPQTNITEHARIDLDQQLFAARLAVGDFTGAKTVYEGGLHSQKAGGVLRTLRGFSTGISTAKADAPLYRQFASFYGSPTYADNFVWAALNGAGQFFNTSLVTRQESANKGSAYGNSWMYVVLEMYDALDSCVAGNRGEALQHWDEAWAFYAGSLEGPAGTPGLGMQPYSLAEKRCAGQAPADGAGLGVLLRAMGVPLGRQFSVFPLCVSRFGFISANAFSGGKTGAFHLPCLFPHPKDPIFATVIYRSSGD